MTTYIYIIYTAFWYLIYMQNLKYILEVGDDFRRKSLVRLQIYNRNLADPFKITNGCKSWTLIVESLNQQLMTQLITHFIKFGKLAKIWSCHCTCKAGTAETNHVAAVMFQVETAVCNGFANPLCTSSTIKWLPCRKDHELTLFGFAYILRQKIKMLHIWIWVVAYETDFKLNTEFLTLSSA